VYAQLKTLTRVIPIVYDPFQGCWRKLDAREEACLLGKIPSNGKRSDRWTPYQKYRGKLKRLCSIQDKLDLSEARALIVPELFNAKNIQQHLAFKRQTGCPILAIFYDAIPLKLPHLSPPNTVAYFPSYLKALQQFDGIAAISKFSSTELSEYWRLLPPQSTLPTIRSIPLGTDLQKHSIVSNAPLREAVPMILCVSTLEGRKNHLALLEAAERLWLRGIKFRLELVGMLNRDTGLSALTQIETLQKAGHPLVWHQSVDAETLHSLYQKCYCTIYPSLREGFGMPLLESISYGKPCLCTKHSALAETMEHGGCLELEGTDAYAIAKGMETILTNEALYTQISSETSERPFRTWNQYALEILDFVSDLRNRALWNPKIQG
jgi:glycosyltransferase involved in cell wall biosynthesis